MTIADPPPTDGSHAEQAAHHHLTSDDVCLEDLGYRPELKRNFSKMETFGVAFSIMYVLGGGVKRSARRDDQPTSEGQC